jgi:hypothetical protein
MRLAARPVFHGRVHPWFVTLMLAPTVPDRV